MKQPSPHHLPSAVEVMDHARSPSLASVLAVRASIVKCKSQAVGSCIRHVHIVAPHDIGDGVEGLDEACLCTLKHIPIPVGEIQK